MERYSLISVERNRNRINIMDTRNIIKAAMLPIPPKSVDAVE